IVEDKRYAADGLWPRHRHARRARQKTERRGWRRIDEESSCLRIATAAQDRCIPPGIAQLFRMQRDALTQLHLPFDGHPRPDQVKRSLAATAGLKLRSRAGLHVVRRTQLLRARYRI